MSILFPHHTTFFFLTQTLPLRLKFTDSARLANHKLQGFSISTSSLLGLQLCTNRLGTFICLMRIQIWVFMSAWQTLYQLSYLLSPSLHHRWPSALPSPVMANSRAVTCCSQLQHMCFIYADELSLRNLLDIMQARLWHLFFAPDFCKELLTNSILSWLHQNEFPHFDHKIAKTLKTCGATWVLENIYLIMPNSSLIRCCTRFQNLILFYLKQSRTSTLGSKSASFRIT